MRPLNECIYKKCFATLWIDYEYAGDAILEPYVSGRVLYDGCFHCHISATTREELIEKFIGGNY